MRRRKQRKECTWCERWGACKQVVARIDGVVRVLMLDAACRTEFRAWMRETGREVRS